MDIEEAKKFAKNKIDSDAITKQVRDIIKITKWQKQDAREGFKETFQPLIESQDSIKKSIDDKQNATLAQLQANQLALTQGLNENRKALTEGIENLIFDQKLLKEIEEEIEEESEEESGEPSGETSVKKGKISKFDLSFFDRYLISKESRDILKEYGYDHLPSYYIIEDDETVNILIKSVLDDINNLKKDLRNTAETFFDDGYVVAKAKNTNPKKLTKKNINDFNNLNKYYKQLIDLKNFKEQKKTGSGITLFKNPHEILKRLELLAASILAGNNGVIPEFSKLAHLLNQMKVISNKQLNDLLKTYITIR